MKTDLFKSLPPEIITNILSRLPVRTIASSKCVCKPWLDLLSSDYFVNSHLAKSVPSLAVLLGGWPSCCCKIVEFEDELESHGFRYNPLTEFDFPHNATIVGAANGLLLLKKIHPTTNILYICNPITCHYVEIPVPKKEYVNVAGAIGFGFGVNRITAQYKVVQIYHMSQFCVYTVGTGSWRRIGAEEACPLLSLVGKNYCHICSSFVDGHLYWTVSESSPLIACFDLETECLSSFSAPASSGGLSVLKDCLYFCEWKDGIVLWLMKEYGVEKSWKKEYFITQSLEHVGYGYNVIYPIKVFKNGDILMLYYDMTLLYYSNKTETFQEIGSFCDPRDEYICISSITLTPSFLSLQGLGMENVVSF